MNKKNYLESLKDIQEMSSRLKRFNINNTLNESVMFNEEFNEDIPENEEMPEDDFDMEQDEYYFDFNIIDESVSLLINSKEQIIVEKLKSLSKFSCFK